ncbi:processed acidic surface protein [Shouchella hunanensis]|uniref:Processed acidic surface protein n=1 Tax=Shouchella hunanensis TaxID=766894 RepID=A0ABY7W8A4_9BACI|nr:processed acidic surface protein [Shouchella hunanensis]WDF05104.1 processed acidic surface protein [Shouchella hunanensis]
MKKLLSLSLIFTLLLSLIAPSLSFAHSLDQDELNEYLAYIDMTEEELEIYLNDRWQTALDEFSTVEELEDYLGDLLTEESYYQLLEDYGVSEDDFLALLEELMISMDYFIFYDDLDMFLWAHFGDDDWYEFPDLSGYLKEFSLSDEELWNLMMHFLKVRETNPHLSADLNALKERGFAFRDGAFESITELNAQEIAELFAIGEKAIDLLKLQPAYYVDKAGQDKKPVDLAALAKSGIEKEYKLLVELYNESGDFLADFYITPEMFNSHFIKDILDDVNNIGKEVEESLKETPKNGGEAPAKKAPVSGGQDSSDTSKKLTKTVDGAKMPKTSSNYPLFALLGLGLMGAGLLVFRRSMKKEAV